MKSRKTIACIIMYPEGVSQQRILEGLQTQCERYDYDLAVFSPLVEIGLYYKDFLCAEKNILNLPNFSRFDAVVIASTTLSLQNSYDELNKLVSRIKKQTNAPVFSLDYELDGCICIHNDDTTGFYELTTHLIEQHGCKKIYLLTGYENNQIAEARTKGYVSAMQAHGLTVLPEDIFFGNFWYDSGEQLADRIAAGDVEMPDAVVCAGDHPAIGLANRLLAHGIGVPEQVIVTGHDSTAESVMNVKSITTYTPATSKMGAEAINRIRAIIQPELPVFDTDIADTSGIMPGDTCGCKSNSQLQKKLLSSSLYRINRNYGDESIHNVNNLSSLVENFMLENLAKTETPLECLKLIYSYTYLLEPYDHFYLCLKPDWLDTDTILTEGYPDTMRCVIHSAPIKHQERYDVKIHCRNEERDNFDTSIMLPALWENHEKPCVFYFVPCHFSDNTLGYAVYSSLMERKSQITIALQMWMRNVNTALEMVRTRNRLMGASLMDSMTKLNNRRGMTMRVNDLISVREPDDKLLCIVIDMDGLKHINDTYGHNEGDSAIITVASVIRIITERGESSCRAGGDEFYILGVGKFTDEYAENKIKQFYTLLENQDRQSIKPYHVTASVGYSIMDITDDINISEAIAAADRKMYISKSRRKQRLGG